MIAIIFYTIQLYTEFSGCMDIVRGSAQLFSIRLPDNLDSHSLRKVSMNFGNVGI